jgi:predicted transposase YbfD/YdcC
MEEPPLADLRRYFAALTDPRSPHARPRLLDMLVIAICAVLCGAEGWEELEESGGVDALWFEEFLDLPHGMPSPDPCRRVLARLDPEALPQGFLAWTQAVHEATDGERIALDGTTLRRSLDRAASQSAMHLVRAWAQAPRLVLGQRKVDDKSNAITAIPQLLRLLHLEGCRVTLDAMGCQKEIAQTMTTPGADDVLALKATQGTLYDDGTLFLQDARAQGAPALHTYATVDADQGRMETRTYWSPSAIAWGGAKPAWANLQRLGRVEARRERGTKVETATRFSLTSLPADAVRFAQAVRGHWHIDNRLHWG